MGKKTCIEEILLLDTTLLEKQDLINLGGAGAGPIISTRFNPRYQFPLPAVGFWIFRQLETTSLEKWKLVVRSSETILIGLLSQDQK